MSEDTNVYESGDASREFYRNLNTCRGCGRPLFTHEQIAQAIGVSRRQFYRWLARENSPRLHDKIVTWLVENRETFRR